jgi:hypothetical protein
VSTNRYRLSPSGLAMDQMREAVGRAEAQGELVAVTEALEWAREEMQRTPHEFGESRGFLPHAKLHRRIAFAGPLAFHFGIHDESATVFLVRVIWARRR